MPSPPLTRRQKQIVDFIESYTGEYGISPPLEEIAQHFGVNKVTIFGHVAELERKGVLRKAAKGISRGLQLVTAPHEAEAADAAAAEQPVPNGAPAPQILGRIAAGSPIEAIEIPETLDFGEWVPGDRDVYALHVRGDSMIEDAIQDGDIVLIEKRDSARNSEIVVAVLPDGTATLKRFYREDDGVRLQPANSSMEPIVLGGDDARNLEIRGVVIGVVRRY